MLASMANLPKKEDILSTEPHGLDQRSGNALLAGLIQVGTSEKCHLNLKHPSPLDKRAMHLHK